MDRLRRPHFAIASTYEVQFSTEVTGILSGHHQQSVFVFTPSGASYIRYDVAFATESTGCGPISRKTSEPASDSTAWAKRTGSRTLRAQ